MINYTRAKARRVVHLPEGQLAQLAGLPCASPGEALYARSGQFLGLQEFMTTACGDTVCSTCCDTILRALHESFGPHSRTS